MEIVMDEAYEEKVRAFKIGFTKAAADCSKTPQELIQGLEKRSGWLGDIAASGSKAISGLAWPSIVLGLGVPVVGGAYLGHLLGRSATSEKEDLQLIQMKIMRDRYRRLLRELQQEEAEREIASGMKSEEIPASGVSAF